MEKDYIRAAFSKNEGEKVRLAGWVNTVASLGKLLFINLRDSSGLIQVVVKKDKINSVDFDEIKELGRESSILVEGEVRKDKRAPGGVEILAQKVTIASSSSKDFPIRKGVSSKVLGNYRHLSIRSRKFSKLLLIRSELLRLFRDWLIRNDFKEFSCPTLITAACEGGATLFELNYFGKKAYLTQSSQFYLEAGIFSLEKVFTLQPSFRAEKSKTRRHLTEFWHLEVEEAWCDLNGIINLEEDIVADVLKELDLKMGQEIRSINPNFSPPEKPFKKITYDEAIALLSREGIKVEWGSDLGADEEKALVNIVGGPVFVTHFPKKTRAFYHKPDPQRDEVVLSNDLLFPKVGEIIGGGERISDYNVLLKRIKEEGYSPKDYSWYLDLRKYGSVPHAGFGLGIERVLVYVLDLPNIKFAIPFPRTISRIYP
ncbi:MAG: asparagine--tRNA ligase [Thermoproteota archaeon]|nr:asparagine--tRNA ligase [Candidatus Brockarchaeota archaeon]